LEFLILTCRAFCPNDKQQFGVLQIHAEWHWFWIFYYKFYQPNNFIMDTMKSHLHDKIKNLGSAIFFNQSDAVLKLQTSIVRIIHVDEFDRCWFYIQKPPQQLNEFEKEFPVKLDFFRKGLDYSLQVIGTGNIIIDPEEMMNVTSNIDEVRHFNPEKMILVSVRMTRADYFENITGQKTSWFQNALNVLHSWIFPHASTYGPITYYPGMSEVS
jgi:hypothetical protein